MKLLNKIKFYLYSTRYLSQSCKDVRVRFAPSPTGFLHLGGLKTALYNYLFARASNGVFILRIEDTDQTRIVPEATNKIQEALRWMGITIDEGPTEGGEFGPYIQSQRLKHYQAKAKVLIENGAGYHCFCTERRLELLRKECAKRNETPRYDNHCRYLTSEEIQMKLDQKQPYVIRFKLHDEPITFDDLVYGSLTINVGSQEGDFVVLKSDGYPTYHLANIVDDHLMKITHVLRGVEWQASTTKHILLHKALNQEPPSFAHLPLIINKDGKKFSKRQQDIHLEYFKDKGYHPLAILNFLVRVGGGCIQLDETVYTMNQLIDKFSLKNIRTTPSRLEMERLDDLNQKNIHKMFENGDRKLLVDEVRQLVKNTFRERLGNSELQEKILQDDHIERILLWSLPRISVLQDLVKPNLQFLWIVPDDIEFPSATHDLKMAIKKVSNILESLNNEQYSQEELNKQLRKVSKEEKIGYSWLMKLLRVVLSNLKEGPSVAEIIEILGKQPTLDRLNRCYNLLTENKSTANKN